MNVRHSGARAMHGIAAAAMLFAIATPALADDAAAPQAVVDGLDQSLIGVMQNAQALGYKGRYAKLEPVVSRVFDIPLMTRVAVGSAWSSLSPEQQSALTDAFGKFVTATYAERFDGYSGERFVDAGTRPMGTSTLVATKLVKSDGTPVELSYVTRQGQDGRYRVVDVFLTGTISELATRRSEFSAVFQRAGYDGLLQTIEAKVAQLGSAV